MVKVECDGCGSPYEVEERRIPAAGLKMRCPKCGKSLLVKKPGGAKPERAPAPDAEADLPAAPAKPAAIAGKRPFSPPRPGGPAAPRPAAAAAAPPPIEPELPALAAKPKATVAKPDTPQAIPPADIAPADIAPVTKPFPGTFGDVPLQVAPSAPLAAPPASASQDAWGAPSLDLPAPRAGAPTAGRAGRPAPAAAGRGMMVSPAAQTTEPPHTALSFGEIDLPLPSADPNLAGPGILDLPSPSLAFGEVDLPMPSQPFSESHLPTVGTRATAPVRITGPASDFGEIDLPANSASLPATLGQATASMRFGEIDLPSPSREFGEIDLPSAADEGSPILPSPARHGKYGVDAALPAPAQVPLPVAVQVPLPVAAQVPLPVAAQVPLPIAAQVPLPETAPVFPPAPRIAGAEVFAEVSFEDEVNLDAAFADPAPAAPRPPPRPPPAAFALPTADTAPAPPADIGEEFSLGEADMNLSTGAVVSPPSARGTEEQLLGAEESLGEDGVGGELELREGDGSVGEIVVPAPPPAPPVEAAPRRIKALKYLVAGVVLAAVGGGSLALVPNVGAFGIVAISDRINASAHASALDALKQGVQGKLDIDTFAMAVSALAEARAAQAEAPRHGPTAAYAAFVAFSKSVRFGRRSEDEALGKQLLAIASSDDGDVFVLATAAQDIAAGQLARARQAVGAILERTPDDADAAALAGEVELSAKVADQAVAAFKRAVRVRKSARTLFGLARAQLATGDVGGAEASAKGALQASPNHAGARLLLASITLQEIASGKPTGAPITPAREAEALAMLAKVTDDQAVRSNASDAELVEVFTLIGHVHLTRSRMTAAEQAFAAALKLDPQAVQALVGNGELFYRAGRFSEALARFEAAIRADADSVAAKVGAAKTWLALERMKEAKDLLKKLREARPGDPVVAYWLGRTEEILGNKKEAEQGYLDAIKVGEGRPEVVDAYVALSHLLSSLGRADEAQAKLTDATAKFPDLTALFVARGDLALQTGRYEDAKREFLAALDKGEDLGTRYKLGVALRRLRDFTAATEVFDKVAAVDKDYPGLALERGLLFEETGQSERALESYADALRKAPNDADLKLRVGSAQVMANHAKQAEPMLRDVLKERPNSAEANHFLGRALLVRGTNLAEAMRYLERAVEIDPNRAEYHLYVGWGANDAGQPGRAEAALKRALELDRELGDAYWQKGVLLQKQGAPRDALIDLETALKKRSSRYEAYATMALCFQDLGRWAEAEDAWRKAIAANDSVAEWHYRLGKIYATRGNRPGALTELDKAVALAEAPDRPSSPAWLFDAHFLVAEATGTSNPEKAIRHYRAFLATAPSDNAYRIDAQHALQALERQPQR